MATEKCISRVSPQSYSPFLPPLQTFPFTARACLLNLGKNTGRFAVYLGCGFA